MYQIKYHKQSLKEISLLKQNNLDKKTKNLIELLKTNPYQTPPPYEKLTGNLKDLYSRRINIQHKLVYKIDEEKKVIYILSMWSHYENL